jgi:L-threonylcarbamoyladenylate synthase
MLVRIFISERSPDAAAIERAAAVIRAGGLVALPTDTLYGLAVDPFNADAVARVFAAKGRGSDQPLPLIAADEAQIEDQLGRLPPLAAALAGRFWPGPLTLLMAAPRTLAAAVTGGTGRVGVRVPAHDVARALCRASGSVLTATSANVSGEAATDDPDAVARSLAEHVDLLVDAGRSAGGQPSTIVDVTGSELRLVRAGAIPWEEIKPSVHRG